MKTIEAFSELQKKTRIIKVLFFRVKNLLVTHNKKPFFEYKKRIPLFKKFFLMISVKKCEISAEIIKKISKIIVFFNILIYTVSEACIFLSRICKNK